MSLLISSARNFGKIGGILEKVFIKIRVRCQKIRGYM
jgi:hypothetical protein